MHLENFTNLLLLLITPLLPFKDPFDKDDWESWSKFTSKNGDAFQVVGDDLTIRYPKNITHAIMKSPVLVCFLRLTRLLGPSLHICYCSLWT